MNEFDKRTGRSYTDIIQTRTMINECQASQLQQLRPLDKFDDDNDNNIISSDYSGNNCNNNCTHTCIENSSIHDDDCTHTQLSTQEISLLLKSRHERSRVVSAAELQLTTVNTAVTSDSSVCSVYSDSVNSNESSFTAALDIMRLSKTDVKETLPSSYQPGSSGCARRRSKNAKKTPLVWNNKNENGYHNKQKITTSQNVPYSHDHYDNYDFGNSNLHIDECEYRHHCCQTQQEDKTQNDNASVPSIKIESLKDQDGMQEEIEVLVSPSLSIPTSTLGTDADSVPSHLVLSAMNQSSLSTNSNLDKTSPLSKICLDDSCSHYHHLLHRHRHTHNKQTHWLDTIKSLFSHNNVTSGSDSMSYKNNNILILSSPTTATAPKTKVTSIPTTPTAKPILPNLCPTMYCCTRHQVDNSPQTPEYEQICKEELQRRQQNELKLDKNRKYYDICHHWDVNVSAQKEPPNHKNHLYYHDDNQFQMKTVKKRNTKDTSTTSFMKNQSQIKTAKKKNTTTKRTLTKSNNVFQTQQECYFSGFDGKRSHYTYVSPKKDENGYPIIELDDVDNDLFIGKNIDFMTVAASTTSTTPTTTSPEIILQNETSVLHVISPKTKSPTRTVHDDFKGYYEMMNTKRSIDASTSSSLSMISEEVRMSNKK